MSFIQEFKTFALRGNALDMAVGIIIGAAFGKIISSLVNDVLMPPIGLLVGGMDFSNLAVTLKGAAAEAPAVLWKYGSFLNTVIDFVIVAFAIFLLIRTVNRFARRPEPAPAAPTTRKCPHCLMEVPLEAKRCGHCTSVIA